MLSFAVAPGLGIALGGIVNTHFGWMSCFYVCAAYGIFLGLWLMKLPDVKSTIDKNALNLRHLWHNYAQQFKNKPLVACGLLMGCSTILPNASSMAMQQASNKPNGSAVMSFINMGISTCLLLNLSFFSINLALLPMVFVILCLMMMGIFFLLRRMD